MTVGTRTYDYEAGGVRCRGTVAADDSWAAPRPTVLVCHGIEGPSEPQVETARQLAEWGYTGVAVDVFGTDAAPGVPGEAPEGQRAMDAFMADRAALRRRLLGVVAAAAALPEVDEQRVVAMGFCFGGLCVLDLARANAGVIGVASFHGVLGAPDLGDTEPITAKVLVLHGWDDPYATPADVTALGAELTARGADWWLHAYGGAMHAFMARGLDNPEAGVRYHPVVAARAWESLRAFLAEVFA